MNLRHLSRPTRIRSQGSRGTVPTRQGGPGRIGTFLQLVLALWLASAVERLAATTLPPGFAEQRVNGPKGMQWSQIVGMQFEDNGRLYVWERAGHVWFQESGDTAWKLLIDLSEEVGAWRDLGLLGFALDPNFRVNGHFYLMYVVDRHHLFKFGTPDYRPSANEFEAATIGRITRYTARADDGFTTVDLGTRQVLLGESPTNGIPILYASHGVGSLVFGTDGTLLASCGDGGSFLSVDVGNAPETYFAQALTDGIIRPKENVGAFRAQLVDSLGGKILRIDPATGDGIPSNPFFDAADPRAARSRVWALGFRNPFRMTLRPGTGSHVRSDGNPGSLYIGDVGWNNWEDLNLCTRPGQNFGWPSFEGIEPHPAYSATRVPNLDAPNPHDPDSACSPYFTFNDLLKQNTIAPAGQPPFDDPCLPGQKIPGSIPQFLHTPPVLEWKHSIPLTRTWIANSNGVATPINLDAADSPVPGRMFPGNCSVGGVWYTGADFPPEYRNTYFHADLGANWIRNFSFDPSNQLVSVNDFETSGGGIVAMATHPIEGGLYVATWSSTLMKISFQASGNLPPTAAATADRNFGPGPLTVEFTGQGSSDPEGLPLTFDWDFGDGTEHSSATNPSHVFHAPAGVPTRYDVTLKVTDDQAQTSTVALIISVNNTPPRVTITSPAGESRYPMSGDTVYDLTADVADAESTGEELQYAWHTFLHHNNHEHQEPVDTNHVTTSVISPAGCDGINIYYYRVELTVTDPAGLSTTHAVALYPDCDPPDTPPVISDIPDQVIVMGQSTAPLEFTVSDAETASIHLETVASSSNPRLVPEGRLDLAEVGAHRTVRVTPAKGEVGTATITVTVNDGPHITSTSFLLTVSPVRLAAEILEDTPTRLTLPDSGMTGAVTFSIVRGPAQGSLGGLNPNSGTVIYTPATNYSGPDAFIYAVDDGHSRATNGVSVTVTEVNDAPVLLPITSPVIDRGSAWSFTLLASDSDRPAQALTYSLVNGPVGLTVLSTGQASWNPAEDQGPASYPVMVLVSDDGSPPRSDLREFNLVVNDVTAIWQIGTDDDPLGIPYVPEGEFSRENGRNDPAPGRVTQLPDDATAPGADDDFYFGGSYPPGFNELTSLLNVPEDEPPLAWEWALTTADRANRIHFILAPGQVTPGSAFRLTMEVSRGGSSAGGFGDHDLAVRFRNGSGVTTPVWSWRISQKTNLVIEFLATAVGATEGPATIELERTGPLVTGVSHWLLFDYLRLEAVSSGNTPPVLTTPDLVIDELIPFSSNLKAEDGDVPAQTLTFVRVSGPEGLTVSPEGTLEWTPTEIQGPDSYPVMVQVTDSGSPPLSTTNEFSISVREVNLTPVLKPVTDQTLDAGTDLSLTLGATDEDIPVQSLLYALVNGPDDIEVTPGGALRWTPRATSTLATNVIEVSVTDGISGATNRFTVVVVPVAPSPTSIELRFQPPLPDGRLALEIRSTEGTELVLESASVLGGWTVEEHLVGLGTNTPVTVILPSQAATQNRFLRVRSP